MNETPTPELRAAVEEEARQEMDKYGFPRELYYLEDCLMKDSQYNKPGSTLDFYVLFHHTITPARIEFTDFLTEPNGTLIQYLWQFAWDWEQERRESEAGTLTTERALRLAHLPDPSNNYHEYTREVLDIFGLDLTWTPLNRRPAGCGQGYEISLRRKFTRTELKFDWWDSIANRGNQPSQYDIMSTISSEMSCSSYAGYDTGQLIEDGLCHSRAQALAVLTSADKMWRFFTDVEREYIAKIN